MYNIGNTISVFGSDGILDTESSETKKEYLKALNSLVEEVKGKGSIDKFYLIREDDYFPYEYQWMPTCENTQLELTSTKLSSSLRVNIVLGLLDDYKSEFGFYIPVPQEVYNKKSEEVPKDLGNLLVPAHFRSTKHFTVNTPLGYTHSYNQVKSKRKFIIIDSAQAFLDSPYHYSIGYLDAYLDVTHEFMPISEHAIILMSEENYKNSLNDKELQNALSKRKLKIFKGDESVAINMVLASQGVLPYMPGNHYMEYDLETINILKQSMQDLANKYNLLYNQSHGNINGKGGHFSDLYDGISNGNLFFENQVIQFLRDKFPECSNFFRFHQTFDTFIKSEDYLRLIQKVGWESIVEAFNEYNKEALINFSERRKAYIAERSSITKEQHDVFVKTIEAIKDNYNSFDNLNSIAPGYLRQQMISFFHSYDLKSQYDAAINILDFLEKNKDLCH